MGSDRIENTAYLTAGIDAERTVLGTILMDDHSIVEICNLLQPHHFLLDSHRTIYAAMLELAKADRRIDIVTLAHKLGEVRMLDFVGGRAYIASLTEGLPWQTAPAEYIQIIRDQYIRHQAMVVADRVKAIAADLSVSGIEIASNARVQYERLAENCDGVEQEHSEISHHVVEAMGNFNRRRNGEGSRNILYSSVSELDDLTGGMFPGEVTTVGADSGAGKSSILAQSTLAACIHGDPCVLYSMEMTGEQVADRMASIISKVPFRYVRHPETANASQAEEINRGYLALAELPLHIYERATMQLAEIVASMRYHILRKGAKLVGVDYAQRILVPNQKEVRLQVSDVAKQLAIAVKGTPSHLMLLSQLKRRHDGGVPSMSDLRESGQLENDAHNVLLLWREGREDEYGTAAKIIVAKSRFGFTGTVNATFNKDFAVFEDATNAAF